MSEDKREQLARTLSALDRQDQAWVINFLVQSLVGVSSIPQKRKSRKFHSDDFTTEDWDNYFEAQHPVELPIETPTPSTILKETSGKTIKPLQKWL